MSDTPNEVVQANPLAGLVDVSLPDVVDGATWIIYQDAQQQYAERMVEQKHVNLLAYSRFVGIAALVQKSAIHLTGPAAARLREYLQMPPEQGVPGPIIRAVSEQIAVPFEKSFSPDPNGTGPASLSALLGITSGPTDTASRSN